MGWCSVDGSNRLSLKPEEFLTGVQYLEQNPVERKPQRDPSYPLGRYAVVLGEYGHLHSGVIVSIACEPRDEVNSDLHSYRFTYAPYEYENDE